MEELKDSLPKKAASFVKENEEEDGLSDSLSEERKFEGSQEGIGENDWIHEASDQNLKDGFSRAVLLFALELGRLNSKLKSMTKDVDHQRQLRLIHEKFKEEVNPHLQDCRSTVEGLESDQIEIKGALEKQIGKEQLLQLKHVMTMCTKEGILN
ncbi:hypothetical protein L6164_010370 [Bauhinia variegata]|uniref:Uncharacterized protein n=1 Tax=Bauhinia variegata TaxID=167791 RepID=A0ACB9PP42_BAUVA|nr:hypothetical protein L6164_010370 [Bauhinia variegata]